MKLTKYALQATMMIITLSFTTFIQAQWSASGTNIFNTNTGNVGIGTNAPGAKLQVFSTANPNIQLTAPGTGGNANLEMGIATCAGCFSPHSTIGDAVIRHSGKISHVIFSTNTVNESKTRSFTFADDNGKIMQIWNGGKVQIGNVNTPGNYRLYVKDGILTEKVKISLSTSANWADYVFSPGYRLKPLQEVEAFVKKNKHLPGIPSAEQLVAEGGIDVNQMFSKQMEKIEELTLYMIELKKEIEKLKIENAALQTAITNSKK